MSVVGEAFVEIRPSTSGFGPALDANVSASVRATQQTHGNLKVSADTTQAKQSIEDLKGSFNGLRSYAQIVLGGLGIAEAFKLIKQGVGSAMDEGIAKIRSADIFGPANAQLQTFIANSAKGLTQTTGDLQVAGSKLGTSLSRFMGPEATANTTEQLLTLGSKLVALNPGTSLDEITAAFNAAAQSGMTRGLAPYGLKISQEQLNAEAVKQGFLGPDTQKQHDAADKLATAQERLNKLQSAGVDPAKARDDTLALHLAQMKQAEALAKLGPASYAYQSATLGVNKAQEALTKTMSAAPDPVALANAQDAVTKAQDNLASSATDLTGKFATLTDAQKTATVTSAILGARGQTDAEYAAAQAAGLLKPKSAQTAFSQALTEMGTAALPAINEQMGKLTQWFTDHPEFFKTMGSDIGSLLTGASNFVGFIADHFTLFKDAAIAIGAIWALDKAASFLGYLGKIGPALAGLPTLAANSSLGKLMGLGGGTTDVASLTQRGSNEATPLFVWVVNGGLGGLGGKGTGVPPVAPGGGSSPIADTATVGGGMWAVTKAGLVRLGAELLGGAELGSWVAGEITGGKAADINSMSLWGDPKGGSNARPWSGDYGGNTQLEKLMATVERQKSGDTVFGADWAAINSDPKQAYATAKNALGSQMMQELVQSAGKATAGGDTTTQAAIANELGQFAETLRTQLGLGANDPLYLSYHNLAQSVADGRANGVTSLNDAQGFVNSIQSNGEGLVDWYHNMANMSSALYTHLNGLTLDAKTGAILGGLGNDPGLSRHLSDRSVADPTVTSTFGDPNYDQWGQPIVASRYRPNFRSGAITPVGGATLSHNVDSAGGPITVVVNHATADVDVLTAVQRAMHLQVNNARGTSSALGAGWPDTLRIGGPR